MVENATVRILMADRDFKIVYMNPASVARQLELLPCRVGRNLADRLIFFHKNQYLQLSRRPPQLAASGVDQGEEVLDLNVSAIRDGDYIGPMVTWEATEQVRRGASNISWLSKPQPKRIYEKGQLAHAGDAGGRRRRSNAGHFSGDDDLNVWRLIVRRR